MKVIPTLIIALILTIFKAFSVPISLEKNVFENYTEPNYTPRITVSHDKNYFRGQTNAVYLVLVNSESSVNMSVQLNPDPNFTITRINAPAKWTCSTSTNLCTRIDDGSTFVFEFIQVIGTISNNAPTSITNGATLSESTLTPSMVRTDTAPVYNPSRVLQWGTNAFGQTTNQYTGTDLVQLAFGFRNSVGLKTDGSIVEWGNPINSSAIPPTGSNIISIASSTSHSVAITNEGYLTIWGNNTVGQFNNLPTGNGFIAVSLTDKASIALTNEGRIVVWGTANLTDFPTSAGYVAVAGGYDHGIAMNWTGTVAQWGANNLNQRQNIPPGGGWKKLASVSYNGIVQRQDNTLFEWGTTSNNPTAGIPTTSVESFGGTCMNYAGWAMFGDGSLTVWGDAFGVYQNNKPSQTGFAQNSITFGLNGAGVLKPLSNPTLEAGNNQSTQINSVFSSPLSIKVVDNTGSPVAGLNFTFTAPGGASGTFSNGQQSIIVPTDANGVASATFTANNTAGSYQVTASSPRLNDVNFQLSNTFSGPTNVLAPTTCGNSLVSLSASCALGSITWYDATGANILFQGSPFSPNISETTSYFVACNDGINVSTKTAVVANIIQNPSASPITTNNALNFDGTDDYVSISAMNSNCVIEATPLSDALTIEYWFKGSNLLSPVRFQNGSDYIVAGWNGMHIISIDGGLTGIDVGAAATDGSWHHLAMTWQKSTINGFKSYLDGTLVAQRNSADSPLPTFTTGMYLGAFDGVTEYMNGSLNEVRVWNVARTEAEIQANLCGELALPQTGLLMYYKMDHGAPHNNNPGKIYLLNSANPGLYTGTLNNFTLNGTISNWVVPQTRFSLPNAHTSVTQSVTNPFFADVPCKILAKIEPIPGNPVAGDVEVKTWLETVPPFNMVPRHYQITPAVDPNTATAKVTLYFSQADFDAYNDNNNSVKLPIDPADAFGIANIQIVKYSGSSPNGLPAGYPGQIPTLIPYSQLIVRWESTYWSISFEVEGFSGFFVKTASQPLPVNLISFTGKATENGNELEWKTSQEKNFSHFEIERSENAKSFEKIGNVYGVKGEAYNFTDKNSSLIAHHSSLYYRLKMVDLDGSFTFSKIIYIENNSGKSLISQVYPNPTAGNAKIDITVNESGNWTVKTFDIQGKLISTQTHVLQKGNNTIEVKSMEKGMNYIQLSNGVKTEIRKVVNQ